MVQEWNSQFVEASSCQRERYHLPYVTHIATCRSGIVIDVKT